MPLTVLAKSPVTLRTSKKIYRLAAGDVVELSDAEASQLRASGAPELQSLFVVEDTTPPLGAEVTEPPKSDSGAGTQAPHPEPAVPPVQPVEEPAAPPVQSVEEPAAPAVEQPTVAFVQEPTADSASDSADDSAGDTERPGGRRRRGG